MNTMARSVRVASAACLFILGTACFELSPPVEESLTFTFGASGSVEVASEVTIADPGVRFTDNAAIRDRIGETRRLYGSGLDPWTRRFEAVEWDKESFEWEKVRGGLVRIRRTGLLEDPARLPRFFADLPLAASYARGEGFAELALVPLAPGRASREEREELSRHTEAWVAIAGEYERRLSDLYRYLESHPDRARACLGGVYESCLDPRVKADLPDLLPEEQPRMEALGDALGKLAEFVQFKADQPRSPDELARWVYDPFPGRAEVVVPGTVLEVEGFEPGAPGHVSHTPLGIWRALEQLGGAFVTPDPFVPLLTCVREEKNAPRIELEGILAAPRRAGPVPLEADLRRALDAALSPAPVYRVRWAVAAVPARSDEGRGTKDEGRGTSSSSPLSPYSDHPSLP